jgi:glycosyltransferase involved in cell wall biosynthesis
MAQQYNRKNIVKSITTTGLRWTFTEGALPFGKIPEFYAKIGTFVSLPYKEAGFNMVWLEAMACEVPYIIGTTAGIGEALPIYKVNGFAELSEILIKIKNKELEPLRNQREWIIKNGFVWSKNAEKLIDLYVRAIK